MNSEKVGGSQLNTLCRMPDGSDVRVWVGKAHGSQRIRFGVKNPQSFSPECYCEIVRAIRKVALSCPFVRDHTHEPSKDGVVQEVAISKDQVEIKKGFNDFLLDFGKALKKQGFNPRESRIEPTTTFSVAITMGEMYQRAIEE